MLAPSFVIALPPDSLKPHTPWIDHDVYLITGACSPEDPSIRPACACVEECEKILAQRIRNFPLRQTMGLQRPKPEQMGVPEATIIRVAYLVGMNRVRRARRP